jgi:hypothetical protein
MRKKEARSVNLFSTPVAEIPKRLSAERRPVSFTSVDDTSRQAYRFYFQRNLNERDEPSQ